MSVLFPKQALPNVIELIEHFNRAMMNEIQFYEATKDQTEFQRVLKHLSKDLQYYIEIFESWNQNIQILEERYYLQILAQLLNQGKGLVSKAANLLT